MKLFLKPPIIDISWLKSVPRQKTKTEVINNTDKKLPITINKVLTNLKMHIKIPFDPEAPRYILFLKDHRQREQTVVLHQSMIWVVDDDGEREFAFEISNELWQHLEKISEKIPLKRKCEEVTE